MDKTAKTKTRSKENKIDDSLSRESMKGMTVAQLKADLKQRGLPVSGKKSELITRLSEHMNAKTANTANTAKPAKARASANSDSDFEDPPAPPVPSEVVRCIWWLVRCAHMHARVTCTFPFFFFCLMGK